MLNDFQIMDGDVVEDAQHVDNNENDTNERDTIVAGGGGDTSETEQKTIIHSDSIESDVVVGISSQQHKSTSSLTVKLNKLNCESHCGDDPQPGPSNSAADFDLEVKKNLFHIVRCFPKTY